MRIPFIVIGLLLAAGSGFAQTFQIDYRRAMQTQDTAKVRKVLAAWQRKEPQNPDLFVARFNYLLRKAYRVEVSTSQATGRGLAIQQKDGKPAGSINEGYEPQLLEAARATLREGIKLASERLDMRFGLARTYELTHEPDHEVAVLATALADHKASGKPWRWSEGKALPAPETVFLPESLEEYMLPYWQANTPADAEVARRLAELINQYYPESSLGPFNLGMYYSLQQQPDKAYPLFQQAHSRRPNDWQTLANLTRLAINMNRKAEAQQYLASLQKLPAGRPAAADLGKEVRKMK
ncbi:tetratricopeptide (TPR) repeat protein [Hymenobacter luteus]|uniref:Tetratricopeptide (TPR) repeat protein n=2 Tax=Hymenobacter TaxID=89966 RepID=A0A7W9WBR1_9BACT|nr:MULTISPECIES: tetratricopeptide repeat protein [Hymenobacter]MBB4600535.1 tetratricopeptide (TPR) repeat protein [Hymenobacter latericoloratus]MBB6059258.1 tetratricopeptide (TPR) repeat protein [Hymenobacter luteus]